MYIFAIASMHIYVILPEHKGPLLSLKNKKNNYGKITNVMENSNISTVLYIVARDWEYAKKNATLLNIRKSLGMILFGNTPKVEQHISLTFC